MLKQIFFSVFLLYNATLISGRSRFPLEKKRYYSDELLRIYGLDGNIQDIRENRIFHAWPELTNQDKTCCEKFNIILSARSARATSVVTKFIDGDCCKETCCLLLATFFDCLISCEDIFESMSESDSSPW